MENITDDIVELIGKNLTGEASLEERAMLEKWLEEKESNKKYFDQCKTLFEKTSTLTQWQSFDTDVAWRNLEGKLSGKQKQVWLMPIVWRVAASVIIILGIGYFSYNWLNRPTDIKITKTNESVMQDSLPDGTMAFLNKQTTIEYEFNSRKKERVVHLQGEAFFETKNNNENAFVINTSGLVIRDIGTTFNVMAYPDSAVVEVYVETGQVAMYTEKDSGITISPGETGVYDKVSGEFKLLKKTNENTVAYKTRSFVFHETRLIDVISALNSVYDKKLQLENKSLENCKITVSFDSETIDIIAEVIAETLKLNVTETENEIILSGDACNQ